MPDKTGFVMPDRLTGKIIQEVICTLTLMMSFCIKAEEYALMGATFITGDGRSVIRNGVLHIQDEKIRCAGTKSQCQISESLPIIDASGKFITPGLIDSHVHMDQTGWFDSRPDAGIGVGNPYQYTRVQQALQSSIARWHRAWLCTGITTVFDVGGHFWTRSPSAGMQSDSNSVTAITVGPLLIPKDLSDADAEKVAMFLPMTSETEAKNSVLALKKSGSKFVKVFYQNPQPDKKAEAEALLMKTGQFAREQGMHLIVHAEELENARLALRAGARLLVHSVNDTYIDEEFVQLLIQSGAYYNPTLVVVRNWRRALASVGFGVVADINDPNGCIDSKTMAMLQDAPRLQASVADNGRTTTDYFTSLEYAGKTLEVSQQNLLTLYRAGANIVAGSDSGNPLTMHGPSLIEELLAMQNSGIAPLDLIRMSTSVSAQLLGLEKQLGMLAVGQLADYVILDESPLQDIRAYYSITHVARRGRLIAVSELSRRRH